MRRASSRRPHPPAAWLLLAVLGAATCGERSAPSPPAGAGAEPSRGGTLVIAASDDIAGINPVLADTGRFAHDVLSQLYLTLFEEQPDHARHPPTFAPELAESFAWSDDHRTLTLELRRDARWSDGAPITAEDVRWSWQVQVSPEVAWPYASSKERIEDVEVVGPHTLRVRFSEVTSSQLADLNEGFVLPRHAWSAKPLAEWRGDADWFRRNLVVSGPFSLAEWRPRQEITLVRNPAYHDPDRPLLERIVIRIVPARENHVTELLAGHADFVDFVQPDDVTRLQNAAGIELFEYWPSQYTYLGWNTASPLFAEPEVRRALTQATDREAMIEALLGGRGRVSVSPIVSGIWAHDEALAPWPYDPAEARRILAAHGWKDGDGDGVLERAGERFSFELLTNATSQLWSDAAVVIQSQLARVGVEVRPRRTEFNTVNHLLKAHEYEAAIGAWTIDTSLDLTYAFHSHSIQEGLNFGGYSNPEVDELIDEARSQGDPAAARPLLIEIQRLIHREQPYTFLWESQRLAAARQRVHGVRPNALSPYFDLEDWWVEP